MTAARGDNARATAFFTGFLALAAGGAGLVVAGLVLGFDYLLHGEPGERQALAASRARDRRDRHADALAWLEADRADRARARAAVRDWFAADRDTRGPRPSSEETVGRFLARLWNHAIVDMTRFRKGWKAGRDEARERRADGEKRWWMPEREPVADAPATTPRQEKANPESQPIRDPGVVDAEVVPDPTPPKHSLVPVGADTPPADDGPETYTGRLDALRAEVAANRSTRNEDPSPPLSALR
jgi:hypothetical protein